MPAAVATSSIDVPANPRSAKAAAAARRIDSRRSASRGMGHRHCTGVYACVYTLRMTTAQLEWTEEELLATHPVAEPLEAGGVRCHGGFDAGGTYVSPRTKNRWQAIEAWKEHRQQQFGTPL